MSNTTQNEFMLVKDFSKAVNLSNQAIYLKIRTDPEFKERYVTEINGHMYIKSIALEKVYGVKTKQEEQEESKSQDNDKQALIDALQATIDMLRKELETKNLQIDKLSQALINQQSLMLVDKQQSEPVENESTTADDSKTDNHVVHADSVSAEHTVDRSTVKRKSFFSRFLRS